MKKLLLITFLISISGALYGQRIYEPQEAFSTILGFGSDINPYYFGNNPAFLHSCYNDEMLSVATSYNNTNGSFRKFFDPGTQRTYQVAFRGKKTLENNQVFQGRFAFNREERHNWNWLSTKKYDTGNPFLLGDSTTGRTRYNGIIMEAEYGVKLFDKLLAGFRLDYGVDEGLKEISPRPTTEHRNIGLNLGAGYLVTESFTAGINIGIYDYNEKISYREDEGAIYDRTILYKLRGFDLPFKQYKKVETRYSYNNTYTGNLELMYRSGPVAVIAFGGTGLDQLTLKDDANQPRRSGYWKNETYSAGLKGRFSLSERLAFGLEYTFENNSMWSRHPEFEVLYSERKGTENNAALGLEYLFGEKLMAGAEVYYGFGTSEESDYYSSVSWDKEYSEFGAGIGADVIFSPLLRTSAGVIYKKNNADEFNTVHGASATAFFNNFTYTDILWYGTGYTEKSAYIVAGITPGFDGIINIYLNYRNLVPEENSDIFGDRNFLESTIEFRIKAY